MGINTSSLSVVFVQSGMTPFNNKKSSLPLLCCQWEVFKLWLHSTVANNRPKMQRSSYFEGSGHMHMHTRNLTQKNHQVMVQHQKNTGIAKQWMSKVSNVPLYFDDVFVIVFCYHLISFWAHIRSVGTALTIFCHKKMQPISTCITLSVHPLIPLSLPFWVAAKISHPETIRPNCSMVQMCNHLRLCL